MIKGSPMTTRILAGLADATRLTRDGRVSEALATIRRTLATGANPAPDADAQGARPPRPDLGGFGPGLSGLGGAASWLKPQGTTGPRGAPAVPPGAQFEERAFSGAPGTLGYKLYVPSGHGAQPMPLVVMLHGCTQSPDDFAAGTRMNELAEEHGFLVAYPAQTKAANASRCWNWFSAADQQRDRGEPALIAGVARQVMADFAVAEGRVYVAGLSAGGATAAIMGVLYPDLFAAVGVHSGLACGAARDLPSALSAMRGGASPANLPRGGAAAPPTIIFHGDHDKTVHPANATQVASQVNAGAVAERDVQKGETPQGVRYTRRVEADRDGVPVLEHWVIHGLGHSWSGGSPAGSYTDARGPDASREMIRFFEHHRVASVRTGG